MKKIYITLMLLTLFSFKVVDNLSVYNTPMQANAVCATDYDLDGDFDIVVNHGIDPLTQWGGVYMLENDGYGYFSFMDSVFDSTGAWVVYADTIISNTTPDIIYSCCGYVKILSKIANDYTIAHFIIGPHITSFNIGDINNDSHLDVVFISNWDQYWGVIYNQSDGSFTTPIYYDVDYPPTDIACGDLNGDGRDDVVIAGASCEIYFSSETGFDMQPLQDNAFNVKIDDMDYDGDMDIITFSDAYIKSFVNLYENLGNNVIDTVNRFNINEGCASFFVTDFNNDSLPDALFLTHNTNGRYLLYYNQGGFQMGEPHVIDLTYNGEERRFMYCADMDGNGFVDIITSKQIFNIAYTSSILEILFNDGQGNFVENPISSMEKLQSHNRTSLKCYPNPFKNNTTFEFTIEQTSFIEISVYNLQGKLVKSLTNKTLKGGIHSVKWGGLNNADQACKPGLYIAFLRINGSLTQSTKLILTN
jgi:hypothetical protein